MFSLTSAWALSCHRFQGQSLDELYLHGHVSSRNANKLVDKHYTYVAVSRVRKLAGLSMTEPLPSDLTFYEPDLSFLVHESKLDIMTLRTKLQFAEAWQMDAEAVRSCTLELKEAEQTLATLGTRLTEELDRKDYLLSNPSDWKTRQKSSSVGNKRKGDHIDANALSLKRARQDAPDQEQYEQARNHLDLPDEHEEYEEYSYDALVGMNHTTWGLPDEHMEQHVHDIYADMAHTAWDVPMEHEWQHPHDGMHSDEYDVDQDYDMF
jgi:hypothetical protein